MRNDIQRLIVGINQVTDSLPAEAKPYLLEAIKKLEGASALSDKPAHLQQAKEVIEVAGRLKDIDEIPMHVCIELDDISQRLYRISDILKWGF